MLSCGIDLIALAKVISLEVDGVNPNDLGLNIHEWQCYDTVDADISSDVFIIACDISYWRVVWKYEIYHFTEGALREGLRKNDNAKIINEVQLPDKPTYPTLDVNHAADLVHKHLSTSHVGSS